MTNNFSTNVRLEYAMNQNPQIRFLQSCLQDGSPSDTTSMLYLLSQLEGVPIPTDLTVEQRVLGSLILLDPGPRVEWCAKITADDFYLGLDAFHGWLFLVLKSFASVKVPIRSMLRERQRATVYGVDTLGYEIAVLMRQARVKTLEEDVAWLQTVSAQRRQMQTLTRRISEVFRAYRSQKRDRYRHGAYLDHLGKLAGTVGIDEQAIGWEILNSDMQLEFEPDEEHESWE